MSDPFVAIEVHRDMPTGQLQVALVYRPVGGSIEMYQLAGPPYTGTSDPVRSRRLTTDDVAEIRKAIDEVFPAGCDDRG